MTRFPSARGGGRWERLCRLSLSEGMPLAGMPPPASFKAATRRCAALSEDEERRAGVDSERATALASVRAAVDRPRERGVDAKRPVAVAARQKSSRSRPSYVEPNQRLNSASSTALSSCLQKVAWRSASVSRPSLSLSRSRKADSTTWRSASDSSLHLTAAAVNSLKSSCPERLTSRTPKMSSMVSTESSRAHDEESAATNSARERVPERSASIAVKMLRSSRSWCGVSEKAITSRAMRVSKLAVEVASRDWTSRAGRGPVEVEDEDPDEVEDPDESKRHEEVPGKGCALREALAAAACWSHGCSSACEADSRCAGSFWMSLCTKSTPC
mmetsp:Transcript_26688/g.62296  ORF Transcript_26688/g.62296 Transcript_26688/m.62296 type:complete len:329 (+) Transcript_26688:1013-1999(+)